MAVITGLNTLNADKGIEFLSDAELINAQIERLLFTEIGSVPGYPSWGSRIPSYMYEPMNTDLAAAEERNWTRCLELT